MMTPMFFMGYGQSAAGPVVSPLQAGVTRSATLATVVAGIRYSNTGEEFENAAGGSASYSVSRGMWLDSGTADSVWVERVISSGSLNNSDPGAGRLQLNAIRTYAVQDTTTVGGAVTCSLTFNFYNAASGGSLIGSTGLITLSANREVL